MRFLISLLGLCCLFSTAMAAETPAPAPAGWTATADPLASTWKPKPAFSLSLEGTMSPDIIFSGRPSPFFVVRNGMFDKEIVALYDLRTGTLGGKVTGKLEASDFVVSFDGAYLAGKGRSAGRRGDAALPVWAMKTGQLVQTLDASEPIGFGLQNRLAALDASKPQPTLRIFDAPNGKMLFDLPLEGRLERNQFAISPGGRFLAAVSGKKLYAWDLWAGRAAGTAEIPAYMYTFADRPMEAHASVTSVAFSPDGKLLAAMMDASAGGKRVMRLLVWDAATGQLQNDHRIDDTANRPFDKTPLAWSPDSTQILYRTRLIDRQAGQVVYEVPMQDHNSAALVFLDAKHILVNTREPRTGPQLSAHLLPADKIAKTTDAVRSGAQADDVGLPPLTKADASGAAKIELKGAVGGAFPPPDPAPAQRKKLRDSVDLTSTAPAADGVAMLTSVQFADDAGQVVAYYVMGDGRPGAHLQKGAKSRIEKFDLLSGTRNSFLDLPPDSTLMDITRDGKLALVRYKDERLDVYELAAGKAKHVVGFRPYDKRDDSEKVEAASFIDGERVLTMNDRGGLAAWSIPACKAIYTAQVNNYPRPKVSNTGKYIAVSYWGVGQIIDAKTGQPLANLTGAAGGQEFFFSPDGAALSLMTGNLTTLWDLKTGQQTQCIALPEPARSAAAEWIGEGYLLIGARYLVDLKKGLIVWQYSVPGISQGPMRGPDGRAWCLFEQQQRWNPTLLRATALPHPEAAQALAQVKFDDWMAGGPGSKISLDVSVMGDQAARDRATAALTKAIEAAGMTVADNQPLRLSVNTGVADSKTVEYRRMGPGGGGTESVTVSTYEQTLAITFNGQPLWEVKTRMGGGYAPSMVHLKEGQSVQDAVGGNTPSGLAIQTPLPRALPKPEFRSGAGASQITAKGVEPWTPPARQ